MSMFDDAKVGDKAWSIQREWGEIIKIDYSFHYPILVRFKESGFEISFTLEGLEALKALNPTLFWSEVVIDPPERPKEWCKACKYIERVKMRDCNYWEEKEKDIFLLSQHHTKGCEHGKD